MLLSPSLSASGEAANLGKVLRLPVHLCGNTTCAVVAHQDNHALFKLPNQPLKGVIRDLGGGTRSRADQAILVQQQTQFTPNNPAVIREAFAANLLGAASVAHGVNQLTPIRVDDSQPRQ